MKQPERRIPRDIYETLHFAALSLGGIGAGMDYLLFPDNDENYQLRAEGYCAIGIAKLECHHGYTETEMELASEVFNALLHVGIVRITNDMAVRKYNKAHHKPEDSRITFSAWCKALNVIPDDSPENNDDTN